MPDESALSIPCGSRFASGLFCRSSAAGDGNFICRIEDMNYALTMNWVQAVSHDGYRWNPLFRLSQSPPLRLIIQPLNIPNQILRLMPILTILPLAPIIHAPNLIIQPDRTTNSRANILTMLRAIPQQTHTIRARVFAHAVVQHAKVEAVFERAVLDELALGNLLVIVDQAVCEAEVQFGVGVFAGGAQEDDVAEAFGLAVFALDAVVFVGKTLGVLVEDIAVGFNKLWRKV